MFQISYTKFFLVILILASLGFFWYLDINYSKWGETYTEYEGVVENVPESIKNDTSIIKEFVPTNEWQIIEKDQPIPPGLHVEMNLKTGVKRAKLMSIESMEGNTNGKTNSLTIIHSNKSEKNTEDLESIPHNKSKFKSLGQIKNDLNELNLTIKSDMEIMNGLFVKFNEQFKIYEESSKSVENTLKDLEYLLHQVDTAEVFVKNNGIESIILLCINNTSNAIKAQGALLLGSAASNNQKVQIAALKSNFIPLLLKHIDYEVVFTVQKNCLFALSSICRKFPLAQKQMIEQNGIPVLMSVFKRPKSDSNTILKLKIAQLLEDLVIEIEDAKLTLLEETNKQLNSEAIERVKQYDELHLKDKLVEHEWCNILSNEFITMPTSDTLLMKEEHYEMVEASGKSLLAMNKLCKNILQENKQLHHSLYILEANYKQLSKQDDFFKPLYKLLNELTNTYDPVLE